MAQEQESVGLESLSPVDMLKLLEDEAERLCQIEQKILNQLHHLQVEESIYTQAMKQLETNSHSAGATKDEDINEDDSDEMNFAEEIDRELAEALKATLQADELLSSKDDAENAHDRNGPLASENSNSQ